MKKLLSITIVTLMCTLFLSVDTGFSNSAFADPLPQGSAFTASISRTAPDGTEGEISCRFRVLPDGTVSVVGDGTLLGTRAVALTTAGSIVIPEEVTHQGETYTVSQIGNFAFGGNSAAVSCSLITSITLPDTITSIGSRAFAYNGLTKIELPENLQLISDYAFYYCTGITSVIIPESVAEIKDYAFCRCTGLRTVEYLGNAPICGNYLYTGGAMNIQTVIYHGKRMPDQAAIYNGENLPQPNYYYAVKFFASEAESDNPAATPLSTVILRGGIELYKIDDTLDPSLIYSGTIPPLPNGCNLWMADVDSNQMGNPLDNSQRVFPTNSEYRNIALGTFSALDLAYTGTELTPQLNLKSLLGFALHYGEYDEQSQIFYPTNYLPSYYRQAGGSGEWLPTGDLTTPGTIRVVATGTNGFNGSIATTFNIAFKVGVPFVESVPFVNAEGVSTRIPCFFSLIAWTGAGESTGIIQVARDPGKGKRAIDTTAVGELTIPATLSLYGKTFTTTTIASSAFGAIDTTSDSVACRITKVTIPRTVTQIASQAFMFCSNLSTVVFEGNASTITFGSNVFYNTPNIRNAVYMDKKETYPNLFPNKPTCWYSITYYDQESLVGNEAGAIGKITIREDVPLAIVPNLKDFTTGAFSGAVWSGEVPAYPSWVVDDGFWWAPTWTYYLMMNGVQIIDTPTILRSTLSDSTYAYATQTNDVYTIDDAIVYGLLDGQAFNYTAQPAIDLDTVIVCGPMGGVLREGTDYSKVFSRPSTSTGLWEETADITEPGDLRLILTGMGSYANTTQTISFKINILPAATGYVFKKAVPLIAPNGSEGFTDCQFRVTSATLGEETVAVYSAGITNDKAVSTAATGKLIIPATITYGGVVFKVTTISEYAFGSNSYPSSSRPACTNLTEVEIPDSVITIGTSAFSYMTNLQKINVPGSLQTEASGMYLFANNNNLRNVTIEEGIITLPANANWFYSSYLQNLSLPSTLQVIGSYFFQSTSIQSLHLPAGLISWEGAFRNCRSLQEVTLEEGITSIPDYAFGGCSSLQAITIPTTVKSIGREAFLQAAITSLTIPEGVLSIGTNAFSNCSNLRSVIFEGDVSRMTFDYSFNASYYVNTVVFMRDSSNEVRLLFSNPITTVVFYYRVQFYDDYAALSAGTPLGQAIIKEGTQLFTITSNQIVPENVFRGEVPEYPAGTNFWEFEADGPMNAPLGSSTYAVAKQIDYLDLANARFQFNDGYRYSGETINPLQLGSGKLVSPTGEVLSWNTHYSASFQRQDSSGAWVDAADLKSLGRIQITATALTSSIYSGVAHGVYTITGYMPGDTFVANDVNGNAITYQVLSIGNDRIPARVQVGIDARSTQAVATDTAGIVVIPTEVLDPVGFGYEVSRIGDYAFYRCMGITGMALPATVGSIGIFAFAYENIKTDVQTSNLATLILDNDMSKTKVGSSAFLGCDVLTTVVYGSKKGTYNDFGINSDTLLRYYTVCFYASESDYDNDVVLARVTLKQGSYIFSPSATDYFEGITGVAPSDALPGLDTDSEWCYESRVMGEDLTMVDSLYAYQRLINDNSITVQVTLQTSTGDILIPCEFNMLFDEDDIPTGYVQVGTSTDGSPAIDPALAGTLVIPSEITATDGTTYTVSAIGSFAFGAMIAGDACALTGIEVPQTVISIDQAAFLNCSALSSVTFAEDSSLVTIGPSAFMGAVALKGIELPGSLTTIHTAAFEASGLRFIELPLGLETLGKRTFNECTVLAEVVFGGRDHLDLPRVAGAAGVPFVHGFVPAAITNNVSQLALIDDYSFANCNSLKRIIFDAGVSHLVAMPAAFENSAALETVVYGHGSAPITFSDAAPQDYFTVSYYEDAAAEAAFARSAYLCVKPGTVLDHLGLTPDAVYAGGIPPLAEHYEWAYDFVSSKPLINSGFALKQRISFALDTSDVDGAFKLTFSVGGAIVTEACFGDTVEVVLEELGATSAVNLSAAGLISGQSLLDTTDHTADFVMPGEAVSFAVAPAYSLSLARQSATGLTTEVATLDLNGLKTHATTEIQRYSYWNPLGNCFIATVSETVPLAAFLAYYDIRFEQGDTLIFDTAGSTTTSSISYYELYGQERSYYPYIAYTDFEAGTSVEPSLAISSLIKQLSNTDTTPEPAPGARPSMEKSVQLLFGQTQNDLVMRNATELQFHSGITRITVLSASFKMDKVTASGVEPSYLYTGAEIRPVPVLIDSDGRLLIKDRDYELSYRNNVEAGIGYALCTGMGSYSEVLEVPFRILRAQSFSGESRFQTAAQIALDAYPQGSGGAIIASGASFPDALSATALSGLLDYPIVLTQQDELSVDAEQALISLSASDPNFQAIIVGGTGVVSENAEKTLISMFSTQRVTRIFGADRYSTSLEVLYYGSQAGTWSDTIILASGTSFPDALSISPYAAYSASPILLTDSLSLSDDARDEMSRQGFSRAIVVGGTSAVSDTVLGSLEQLLGQGSVTRLSGANRYDTSLAIARFELVSAGMQASGVAVATGLNFPDALAGGALLGRNGSVLLLADTGDTTSYAILSDYKDSVELIRFFGGESAVSASLRQQAVDALGWSRDVLR